MIVFSIGFVFALELMNSAIENLTDFVSPHKNKNVKKIKDLSAVGVLVASFAALVVGIIVFLPKLILLFLK